MKKGIWKSKNGIMLITLGIVVVMVIIIAVIGGMKQGNESIPTIETIAVTKGNVTQEVEASGNVESEQKKTFYSPVNGEVQTMSAETGDTVEAGQVIIGFNLETLESENQKAELNVRSGQLELADAQQQAADAAAKQAEAQARIPKLEAQIEEKQGQITSLQQQIADVQSQAAADAQAAAQQAAADAAQAYQNALDIYNNTTLPTYQEELSEAENAMYDCQAAFNEATQAYEKEEITVEEYSQKEKEFQQARQAYQDLKEHPPAQPEEAEYMASAAGADTAVAPDTSDLQFQLETASSELAQLQSELASQEAAAEADGAGLSSAAQEQMQISNNLAELEAKNLQELIEEGRKGLQAEFKGVISDAQVTQGATVTQGMELFTLQSTDQVCVEANISKYDFDKVKEGQKASVTLGDSEYQGTVEKISRIAIPNEQGTPLIGVTIHIDDPDDNIFIGVEAQASIQAAQAKDVPLLPVEAVNIGKDGSFCYVVEEGIITEKAIETGVTSDSYVEITKGLKAGDQVIRDIGSHETGDRVVAVEAAE